MFNFLLLIVGFWAISSKCQHSCNPLRTTCPAVAGLNVSSYSVDFTKTTSNPTEWISAGGTEATYGAQGAEFTFKKRYDAPYIWTSFYILFGRVEVVLQAANGTGIITGAVLMSDDQDEIDWEWSGNNFGANTGKVQTNYFGKGVTGSYDRGTQPSVDSPTTQTHTYVLDWTPSTLTWSIDGQVVRTLPNNNEQSGPHQYPQSPSQLHIGVWDGGDPDGEQGVIDWAGGVTDFTKVPYTAYVKSVKISTPNICSNWQYPPGYSGRWQEIRCSDHNMTSLDPGTATSMATTTSLSGSNGLATTTSTKTSCVTDPSTTPTLAQYEVKAGDYGYQIAAEYGITFAQLSAVNPDVQWNNLQIGQLLNLPAPETQVRLLTTPDGAISTCSGLVTPCSTKQTCNQDLCLRNLLEPKWISTMSSICPAIISNQIWTWPTPTTTSILYANTTRYSPSTITTASFPTFLTGCANNTSRVSSACQCLLMTTTPSLTSSTTTRTPSPFVSSGLTTTNNAGRAIVSTVRGNAAGKLRHKFMMAF